MKTSSLIKKILLLVAATAVIVYFYPHPESNRLIYQEGRPWNYAKLIAPFDIPVHADSATIRAARDTLDAHFVPIYGVNQLLVDTIVSRLPQGQPGQRAALASLLRRVYSSGLVDEQTMEEVSAGRLPHIRVLDGNVLSEAPTASLWSARRAYQYLDSAITDTALHRYFVEANLQNLLLPNYIRDEEESRRNYEYSYLQLTADRGIILQGQTIIDKGTVISSQDFTNLQTYEDLMARRNTARSKSDLLMLLGQVLFVAMLLGALMLYLRHFEPVIFNDSKSLAFIFILLTGMFLIAMGLDYFVSHGIYIAPMMCVPILLMVFFNGRTALMTLSVLTIICAGVTPFALEFIFLQFCAGCATVYSVGQLSRRSQLLRSSLFAGAAYLSAYLALELLMNGTFEGVSLSMIVFLAVNAALTSMAYVLLFVAEKAFGFTSVVTLVELADINNPLLMRLSNECPGTFQHSIAVSNLATDAASRVGANVQLIRAGALYHDIGKLNNPAFFTENQHGVNPHDALPPERSAAIITAHIPDGLKLAAKAGLPAVVESFIRQHHGRGIAKYFYFQACKAAGKDVDKEPYQYPGPNPQTVEASILMMADSVEAASRSLKEHTREGIAQLVNKIIDTQIADGLHNESPLAFRDVEKIKAAFIKRLMTIYHSRIAYPAK